MTSVDDARWSRRRSPLALTPGGRMVVGDAIAGRGCGNAREPETTHGEAATVMFTIRFKTDTYRPDLQVTIRASVDGWQEDFAGNYEGDGWVFRLPDQPFLPAFDFKFVLEEQYWMYGANLHLAPVPGGEYAYTDAQVAFPPMNELIVESGAVQQRFFAPALDEGHRYKVIVIGSGIGGGVLADQLADYGQDVLVLEAGSYLFPTHVGNLPRRHPLGGQFDKNIWGLWDDFKVTNYVNAPGSVFGGAQAFNLGGRSVFWGGLIPEMTWWELEAWPKPVRWHLEDSGYKLANELLKQSRLGTSFQDRVVTHLRNQLPDHMVQTAPMAIQHTQPEIMVVPGGVFSTADLLLESRLTDDVTGARNLKINLNHAVQRIETTGRLATAVIARDLIADRERRFTADRVVLAAGTVESAKIALMSGLADPHALVGRGVTDHPIFFTHFAVPASSPFYAEAASAKLLLRHRNAGLGGPPFTDRHRFNIVLELGSDFNQGRFVDPDILARHQADKGRTMLCEIVFLFDAPLIGRNWLQHAGGSAAKPVIDMQPAPITAAEWNEIVALKDAVINAVGGEALAGGNLDLNRAGLGGVAHEVGTLRMGTDEARGYADGVVDADLRFVAYDNLYACDLSVFPTSPAANPTLTLAALALRLADHLRRLS
jgi:choline dehydrogenase-like flavoprotein